MKRLAFLFLLSLSWGAADVTVDCDVNPCETILTPPVEPAPLATGRFVDCSAATNGAGTQASPWNRLANVSGMAQGDDLWLKEGTTCSPTGQFLVSWSGTESDRVVMGAYKVIGGTAYQGLTNNGNLTPYGGAESAGSRPVIQGTYLNSCRPNAENPARTCAYNTVGAVPDNFNNFLVKVTGTYVTVQDLRITASAGSGIGADTPGNFYSPVDMGLLIIQRNYVDHSAHAGIQVVDARNMIIRGNLVSYTGLDYADFPTVGDWPSAINCGRATITNCLIENNYVHDTWTEGIGPYRSQFVVVRGNYVAQTRRAMIYPAGASDVVVEQNIVVAAPIDTEGYCAPTRCASATNGYFPSALDATIEQLTSGSHNINPEAGERRLFRNNIAVLNDNACIVWGATADNVGQRWLSGKHVGNTCYVAAGENWIRTSSTNSALVDSTEKIEIANNLLFGGSTTTNCQWPAWSSVTTFRNNGHTLAYSDSDCIGTNDLVSTNVAMGSFNFATASRSNFPLWSDAKPQATTAFKDVGVAMTATYLTIANWPQINWFQWEPDCGPGNLSGANWAKTLYADYCNITRSATPDLGALEQ